MPPVIPAKRVLGPAPAWQTGPWGPVRTYSCSAGPADDGGCPVVAPNRPAGMSGLWSLLGAKRTWLGHGGIDAFDPTRTLADARQGSSVSRSPLDAAHSSQVMRRSPIWQSGKNLANQSTTARAHQEHRLASHAHHCMA